MNFIILFFTLSSILDIKMKIKYHGITLKVRLSYPEERITGYMLCRYKGNDPQLANVMASDFKPTNCIGDLVSDHPDWQYITVLSKFWHLVAKK